MKRATKVESCRWFLRCTNKANGTMPHPILGPVPICERCRRIVSDNGGKA